MIPLARILLVEDDPADVRLVLAAFRDIGLASEIFVVTDGVQALDYLHRRGTFRDRPPGDPSVVLLDIKLPRVDGLQVLTQMRADPALRLIPVVVLTSSSQEDDLRRAYELGVNGYVVKTVDPEAYEARLRAIGQYWVAANEPPPGSLRQLKSYLTGVALP